MEIMKLTIKEDFRRGTDFSCFSYHKITLFENKYGIKLITSISMYHLTLKGLKGGGVILTPSSFFWITQKRVEIFQRTFSYS